MTYLEINWQRAYRLAATLIIGLAVVACGDNDSNSSSNDDNQDTEITDPNGNPVAAGSGSLNVTTQAYSEVHGAIAEDVFVAGLLSNPSPFASYTVSIEKIEVKAAPEAEWIKIHGDESSNFELIGGTGLIEAAGIPAGTYPFVYVEINSRFEYTRVGEGCAAEPAGVLGDSYGVILAASAYNGEIEPSALRPGMKGSKVFAELVNDVVVTANTATDVVLSLQPINEILESAPACDTPPADYLPFAAGGSAELLAAYNPQGVGAIDPAAPLTFESKWRGRCVQEGTLSRRRVIQFTAEGLIFNQWDNLFDDPACDPSELISTAEASGTYVIDGEGDRPLNLTYGTTTLTTFSLETAEQWVGLNYCEFADWTVGTPKDVTGLTCDQALGAYPANGSVNYTIVRLAEGKMLLGKAAPEGTGVTAETRHAVFDEERYFTPDQ